jgi:Zn-dependent protease
MTPPAPGPSPASSTPQLLGARRIGPSFELGAARLRIRLALGFFLIASVPGIAGGAPRMALCAAVLASALLAHELGHALAAIACGSRAKIVLHVLGAFTEIEPRLARGREIVVLLMGPVASLTLALLLAALRLPFPGQAWLTTAMWINVAWGVVNLLPILPFDGGRVLLAFLGEQRRASALLVSGMLASVIAVEGLAVVRSAALTFLFGAAAVASWFSWAQQRRDEVERALELPRKLDEARRLLASEDADAARSLAIRVAQSARCNATANAAWEVAAWAELGRGRPEDAHRALERVQPATAVSNYCLAAVEAERGQPQRAIALLEREQRSGSLKAEGAKLLIDLHARLGNWQAACNVGGSTLLLLEPEDVRGVIEAAFAWSALASGTKLAEQLFAVTGSPDDAVSQAYGLARMGDNKSARSILSELVTLLSHRDVDTKTLSRLRELATRPDSSAVMDPELCHLVVDRAS